MRIDLNADVGEGYDDAPLLDLVSSANIACGAHAGDETTMRATLRAAAERGVATGAHPGFADRASMGRAQTDLAHDAVERLVRDQVERLARLAGDAGVRLRHVKPHGALYNQAARDAGLARAIARAVAAVDPSLTLVGLAGSMPDRLEGLRTLGEGFADRRYAPDGTLVPRSVAGALVDAPESAASQALCIARGEPVTAIDGSTIRVAAHTICLHGDAPGAIERARAVREALIAAGISIEAS